ncbi:MAG: hypothetical protein V7K88_11180 [Nostoc sp.]
MARKRSQDSFSGEYPCYRDKLLHRSATPIANARASGRVALASLSLQPFSRQETLLRSGILRQALASGNVRRGDAKGDSAA